MEIMYLKEDGFDTFSILSRINLFVKTEFSMTVEPAPHP